MSDHRILIREAAAADTFDIRERLAGKDPETGAEREDFYELLDERVLGMQLWVNTNDPDAWRCEVVLGVGGPTVRVDIDSRWNVVTYEHSWGKDDYDQDATRYELSGVDAEPWRELAEYYAESHACSV